MKSPLLRRTLTPSLWLSLALVAVMLGFGLAAAWSGPLLEFNRNAISSGQWWRLLSGHLVHYGAYHLAMNLLALVIIGYVLLDKLTLPAYVGLLFTCALTVSIGLLLGDSELAYYAGFSGILHGLLLAGLLATLRETPIFNGAALLVIAVKLWNEQRPEFNTEHVLLPAPVAVDAHLYGALAGLLYGLLLLSLQYKRSLP